MRWDYLTSAMIDRSLEMIIVGLVFGGALLFGGWYFAHGAKHPTRWAALSTLGSGFIFGGAYWQLRNHDMPAFLAGARSGPCRHSHGTWLSVLIICGVQDAHYTGAFALHCLAVAGFIAIAIPMQLENSWIAVAWSFELAHHRLGREPPGSCLAAARHLGRCRT